MRVQVSITKAVNFQGKSDEFSNVYTFDEVADDDAAIDQLCRAVVAIERPVFGQAVRFIRYKAWGRTALGFTVMRATGNLTGTGAQTVSTGMYRECAIMVRWPLPFRIATSVSLSNPRKRVTRYLRKYLHTCVNHGWDIAGENPNDAIAATNPVRVYAEAVREPMTGVFLCAPDGDLPTSGPEFPRYMEHRQFPRGRKES